MRKYFITGLMILLPLAMTIIIVMFLVNLLTVPFIGIVQSIFNYYDIFTQGFLFLSAAQVQEYVAKVLILAALFFSTVFIGWITRWYFIHRLLKIWDYLFNKVPFIRSVYKTSQDVINTIFTNDSKSFKQVVLVPFPGSESYSIGLITRESLPGLPKPGDSELVAVFVPTTPNPTSGFLIIFEEKEVIYLDMRVEEALKYVISCGVILNEPFHQITKEQAEVLKRERQIHDEEA
ncbi:MAG: DUF502 domain-containing protein [Chlamydiales bacterium]|nr:DUF502 domain-containing protein [Chlamydiia bacterium]MCP5507272.1 DUF502 domain-containing protein [Chlamydiales bacterium]